MFDHLLVNTATAYPIRLIGDPLWDRDSLPDHKRKLLLEQLNEIWWELTGLAEQILETTIDEHLVESLYYDPNGFNLCGIRLRPPDEYYHRRRRPLPQPANPIGPHATGIELNMSLYRGYATSGRGIVAQRVLVVFRVWGQEERNGFKRFYFDRQKEVEALLSLVPLKFSTARYFNRLDTVDKAAEQLRAYVVEDDDEEHCFELEWEVLVSQDSKTSLSAYVAMLALYSAAYEYMSPEPKERLIKYFRNLDAWYRSQSKL